MSEEGRGLRWGVEQRLEFIEFRLFWENGVNRSDITSFFGMSVPQASKDLAQYQELAPENLRYDRRAKRYFATEVFKPRFLKPDADRYLAQLTSMGSLSRPDEASWISSPLNVDTVPVPHRRVDVDVLRLVVAAARERASVEILYQSMSERHPEPLWRRISPHAFASDGFRWHARAFCHIDEKFKDFLLSRCLEARNLDAPKGHPQEDKQWFEFFDVLLSPNPKLSENLRKVIAQDYGMQDGCIAIPVRRALLFYFWKRLRLDVTDVLDNPYETPVVVTNRAEFDAALTETPKSRETYVIK